MREENGRHGQRALHVGLEASQHEGREDLVELSDHLLLVGDGGLVLEVEERVEGVGGAEDLGHQEVEQRPQLVKVVLRVRTAAKTHLQRRAGEEEAVLDGEAAQHRAQLAVLVLHAVGLVHDHVPSPHAHLPRPLPRDAAQRPLLDHGHLVGGQQHVPVAGLLPQPAHQLHALLLGAVEAEALQRGAEARHLVHPVAQRGLGDQDEVRAPTAEEEGEMLLIVHVLLEEAEQRDGLERLSKTFA